MYQQQFYNACVNGDNNTIITLLSPLHIFSDPMTIYPILLYNFGLQVACKNGHTDIVKILLSYLPMRDYIDLYMSNYYALRVCCKKGYTTIVRLLLLFTKLRGNLGFAVRLAKQNGHDSIVRMLELPQLFTVFITIDVANMVQYNKKVDIAQQLREYQDLLTSVQRRVLNRFITSFFNIFGLLTVLPYDVALYLSEF